MKILNEITVNGKKLYVGVQNFKNDTVNVKVDEEITTCPMFQDEDGDIGFVYEGIDIYFNQRIVNTQTL